ncbi:hypothetical protein F4678DRAFT_444704 [Xylaria arbuscula]|nr:hypothetical protein F4678DRAFT_444704 [Xylaria arbuscula]
MQSGSAPDHTSVPPEDLLVCRYLFGLGNNPFPWWRPIPGTPPWHPKDALLVSVKAFGCFPDINGRLVGGYHVGISVLDLRDFDRRDTINIIKSYQFQVGCGSWSVRCCPGEFLFGNTKKIEQEDIESEVQRIIGNRYYMVVS